MFNRLEKVIDVSFCVLVLALHISIWRVGIDFHNLNIPIHPIFVGLSSVSGT
jgi:hypothetical protein